MSRVLVDTNVLISFLTDRDLRQQEQAAKLFSRGRSTDVLLLHQAVLTEMVFVLTNDALKQISLWRGGNNNPPANATPAK